MNEHMQSVIALFVFYAICGLAAKLVEIAMKKRPSKRGIKVGDCITPKHNWGSYDHEFTDIHAMASAVHKESRK